MGAAIEALAEAALAGSVTATAGGGDTVVVTLPQRTVTGQSERWLLFADVGWKATAAGVAVGEWAVQLDGADVGDRFGAEEEVATDLLSGSTAAFRTITVAAGAHTARLVLSASGKDQKVDVADVPDHASLTALYLGTQL